MNSPVKELLPPSSILDPLIHERLILDIEHICEVANISPQYLHTSMKGTCTPSDIDWVKNFNTYREENKAGYIVKGANSQDRCMYICGALLRNFIDARVYSLNQLIGTSQEKKFETPDPTVLIIPNLFVMTHGKALTSWQIQGLYDFLLARMVSNKPVVAYVQDMVKCREVYGELLADTLETRYC